MSETAQTPTRSSFPMVVAILGAFLIFYFLVNWTFVNSDPAPEAPAIERPSLAEHEAAGAAKLSEFAVVDAASGKVRLPISEAKELVVSENAK